MADILVTGGAGFIGSHVSRRLLSTGHSVRILDNFDPFYSTSIKHDNVQQLRDLGGANFQLLEGDIRDPLATRKALDGAQSVIHLAALAGVRPSIKDPISYMDVNVRGTQTLLQGLQERPTIPFVFASSSSVYGGNTKVPFAESDHVDHPVSPYAASKKAGEIVCHAHHHLHGTPTTCLRFFTVYGPGQRPEMAIHKFTRQILANDPVTLFGDGSTRRDYTYIDDIVDGIVTSLHRCAGYDIINLGGSQTTTLIQLIHHLESALEKPAIIQYLPDQPGDVKQTWADTTRAEALLGFSCQTSIEEGLRRFARWYIDKHGRTPTPH